MTRDSTFKILLIEDNPGDARYIREILRDATELSDRTADSGSRVVTERAMSGCGDEPELIHESRLAAGLEHLDDETPDVVLLDLHLPDSDGLDTLSEVLGRTETIPVVVLTGLRDRETGIEALRRGADEYLVKDEINADLLTRSVYHAIERKAYERRLERQREQLAALNQLNEIVQEITGAVLLQSTREEIERLVCERLADADSYLFAWIGDADQTQKKVSMRVEAGVEGYLDGIEIFYDDRDTGRGPTGRAIRTREMQVSQHVLTDPDYAPWREQAEKYGYQSSAAIPILHEGGFYGVLNVYSERPDAFTGQEGSVIGQLGEVIGHAIASIERKEALMSEDVIEISFEIQNFCDTLGIADAETGTITMDRTISAGNQNYVVYGTADESGMRTLRALVDSVPHWESIDVLSEDDGTTRYEAHLTEPPIVTLVASQSGQVVEAKIEDGDYRITTHLPPGADVRRLVNAVRESYPDAEVIAQRHTTQKSDSNAGFSSAVFDDLTERQRSALELAFYAGFFDWPRESTGEEVAASLDVSAATFHQHLRASERKIFDKLFDGP